MSPDLDTDAYWDRLQKLQDEDDLEDEEDDDDPNDEYCPEDEED